MSVITATITTETTEGVQVGLPIIATIGSVTIPGDVPKSTFDAKGDLLVGSGNDAFDNLAVGANGTVFMADSGQTLGAKWQALSTSDVSGAVATSRTISTTSPITGGGDLSANRTIAIDDGTTSAKGAVQLEDSTSSTSSTKAATPNSVKTAYDLAGAALPKTSAAYSCTIHGLELTTANSGTPTQAYYAGSIFNARCLTSGSQNAYVEWTTPPLAAGTYTLRTFHIKGTDSGIYSISIDGAAALGTTIDAYNGSTTSSNINDITSISLATAGRHTVRYTASTKNASSSGYYIQMHGFTLTRTGA